MVVPFLLTVVCRDNSGIKKAYTVNYQAVNGRFGLALCSLTQVTPNKKLKKGDLVKLLVVSSAKLTKRRTGNTVFTSHNGALWLKKDGSPSASRVYGSVFLAARHYGYLRVLLVSNGTL